MQKSNNKNRRKLRGLYYSSINASELFFADSAYRAVSRAISAGNAGIGVNIILSISLGNSVYGAVSRASSAGNAGIVNFECHNCYLRYFLKSYTGKARARRRDSVFNGELACSSVLL